MSVETNKRRKFLKKAALVSSIPIAMSLQNLYKSSKSWENTDRMPAMFIGHGSPMNIIRDNDFTRTLKILGNKTDIPQAILVISAHWLTRNKTVVSTNPAPKTIYDFGGFPDELYQQKYEPGGHLEMAKALISNVESIKVHEDHEMGLDHGAWSILKHMYPEAEVPVFQMSIDYSKPPEFHFKLASELKALRRRGVLIIGSGNIVHNLRILDWQNENAATMDWASEFDEMVKSKIDKKEFRQLVDYQGLGKSAKLAIPTNDHYLPMLYTLGLLDDKEEVEYTFEGFQHGSISMRCFQSA